MSTETQSSLLPWMKPGWLDLAGEWITARLAEGGTRLSGPVEWVHARPWSTVLLAPIPGGKVFMKASAPVLAHEPGLTQALSRWRPDCIQGVLAVDLERAWMLMPDESPMLRALIQSPTDLTHWEHILPVYAGLQQEMMAKQTDLLRLGLFDRRLTGLPEQFALLLEDRAAMRIDQEDGLTGQQYRELLTLLQRYRAMCERLAGFGIPETLHHDDFHDANVFVPGGRYAFSDWGESCLAHPFFTMLVTLRSIAYRFDWAYGAGEHQYRFAPEILHLRDIYLSCWADYGTPGDILEAFQLAWKVAMVSRALTWHRVISFLGAEGQSSHGYAVPAWLGEFLDALAGEGQEHG